MSFFNLPHLDTVKYVLEIFSGLATTVMAISLFISNKQLKAVISQRFNDFEMMYIQRLWVILDKIGEAELSRDKERILSARISYLYLTNDQVELRQIGRVSDDTWSYWSRDIYKFCNQENYLNILEESEETEFLALKKFIKCGPLYDPASSKK